MLEEQSSIKKGRKYRRLLGSLYIPNGSSLRKLLRQNIQIEPPAISMNALPFLRLPRICTETDSPGCIDYLPGELSSFKHKVLQWNSCIYEVFILMIITRLYYLRFSIDDHYQVYNSIPTCSSSCVKYLCPPEPPGISAHHCCTRTWAESPSPSFLAPILVPHQTGLNKKCSIITELIFV